MPGETVNLVDPSGKVFAVPAESVAAALANGFRAESSADHAARLVKDQRSDEYGGVSGAIAAGGAGLLRGATLGGSDVLFAGLGEAEDFRGLREENPGISTGTEILGAVATTIPSGGTSLLARAPTAAVARLGTRIARTAEGASVATKIGRGALGGAVEGGIQGIGTGVTELALSEDRLTLERVVSSIGSGALHGGLIGGGIGGLGKAAGIGLSKGKAALDDAIANRAATKAADDASGDLAGLDLKGLRARKQAVEAADDVAHKTELETLEKTRVVQRKEVADDIARYSKETSDQWATTKGLKLAASEAGPTAAQIGRDAVAATNQLKKILGNPIGLAKTPGKALDALQRQEQTLIQLTNRADDLKLAYVADDLGGKRLAALDQVPVLLERNRGLQAKIGELNAPLPVRRVSQDQLDAIANAKDALATAASRPRTLAEQAVGGAAMTGGAMIGGAVIPVFGHMLGAAAGAKLSTFIGEKVFGRLGKAGSDASLRASRAVSSFLDVAVKASKVAPPLATKTLTSVRYAPTSAKAEKSEGSSKTPKLADAYKARAAEIRSQTAYGPDGQHVMRPEARAAMAARLAAIAAMQPIAADRMETLAARRIEFLASKLPRRPDMGGMQMGPDRWQPSDMEMRAFARYAAAVEDPHGVIERLSAGMVTPEDAEAVRSVYPELFEDVKRQIVEGLPTLQKTLPYARRLALAIFSGVPVDPSMHPAVLAILQGQFAAEEGSEGGTMAPRAQAAFGSISKEAPTPAQKRNA